jgi:hypothetical protein
VPSAARVVLRMVIPEGPGASNEFNNIKCQPVRSGPKDSNGYAEEVSTNSYLDRLLGLPPNANANAASGSSRSGASKHDSNGLHIGNTSGGTRAQDSSTRTRTKYVAPTQGQQTAALHVAARSSLPKSAIRIFSVLVWQTNGKDGRLDPSQELLADEAPELF